MSEWIYDSNIRGLGFQRLGVKGEGVKESRDYKGLRTNVL